MKISWLFYLISSLLISIFAISFEIPTEIDDSTTFENLNNLVNEGKSTEAYKIIVNLNKPIPDNIKLLEARVLVQLGQPKEGEELLHQIIKKSSNLRIQSEARITLGKLYIRLQKWDEAEEILSFTYKNDSQNNMTNELKSIILNYLAKISITRDSDPIQAITLLNRAIQFNPNDYNLYFELAMSQLYNNETINAKKSFQIAETLNHNIDHKLIGKIYLHYNDLYSAIEEFQKILKKFLTNKEILSEKSNISDNLSLNLNSENIIKPIEFDGESILLLAQSYELINKQNNAKEIYKLIIKYEIYNAFAHLNYGLLLLGVGSYNYGAINACGSKDSKLAIKHLLFALKLDPKISVFL